MVKGINMVKKIATGKTPITGTKTPILRTSGGLREVMFEELELLRNGEVDCKRANAVACLSMAIVKTVRMELEFSRSVARKGIDTKTIHAAPSLILK